jgi:hypothetical protein
MKKASSPRRLAANRLNAQKSTGPKTTTGKAAASMNALKHGALAHSLVVLGHHVRESPRDFKKLCAEFYASLAPVGPMEEMLVDQIITATWRLRRARLAETGEIALSVDTGSRKREDENPLPALLNFPQNPFMESLVIRLTRSAWGCRYLIHCLYDARRAVERDGELTIATLDAFINQSLRQQASGLGDHLQQFRASLDANPDRLEPLALRQQHQAEVLKYLAQEIQQFEHRLEKHESRDASEERARRAAAALPADANLEKILRYEAALERQMYRAINQLERLQLRRRGEYVPAPIAMTI